MTLRRLAEYLGLVADQHAPPPSRRVQVIATVAAFVVALVLGSIVTRLIS
ncbi:MAG: hypothetical protein WA966_08990 [Ornithinimicrobium sp.]